MAEDIPNIKLKILVLRLLGRHYPESLSPTQLKVYRDFENLAETSAIIDFKGNLRQTAAQALADSTELRQSATLTEKQISLLDELETYLRQKLRL
jgi:hypothetical protein